MKVNNLDAAMRVALIGTLILIMLCVISFGLSRNHAIPSHDTAQIDAGRYVQMPVAVQTQPVYMTPAPYSAPAQPQPAIQAPAPVGDARLESLERSIASLRNQSNDAELANRLQRIESQIAKIRLARVSQATSQTLPAESLNAISNSLSNAFSTAMTTSTESTNRHMSEIGGQMDRLSSTNSTGMERLNSSMQQVRESVSGLSGTVDQLDQSVASLHSGQSSLRQTVERQWRANPQVNDDGQQIRADVASLVNGMHELKAEIAGLKEVQSRPGPAPTPSPAVMTSTSAETVQPPATNGRHPDLRPLLGPPVKEPLAKPAAGSGSESAAFLPLAPTVVESAQPETEPFPATPEIPSPEIPSPDFAEPEILPQSATVPPAIPEVEIIEPATLETAEPHPKPQPATLSPNWNNPRAEVPALEAPLPDGIVEPPPAPPVNKITLPAPSPISQMSFQPSGVSVLDDSGAPATKRAAGFHFKATVLHISANSEDVTARPGLVRLEDRGSNHPAGHEAMVQKLLRNAGRHGAAEAVHSGTIIVRPSESGRIAIGSPCMHCNREHGVEAGDEVVLALSGDEVHVEALSPQRGVRVESVPLMQFDPSSVTGETTWLISEEAQEGSVAESSDPGDSRIEFVQRLVVITRMSAAETAPRLFPAPGAEGRALQPASDVSAGNIESFVRPEPNDEGNVYPAGYDQSNQAPRLLHPSTVNDAVRAPRRIPGISNEIHSNEPADTSKSARLNPLKMLQSVFDSHKAEESQPAKSNRSRTGSGARGRSRR